MTGRALYEAHIEAAKDFDDQYAAAELVPWDDMAPALKAAWERRAIEQTERDQEAEHEALAVLDDREDF